MADTFTPHLNLVLPEIGASRSTWGTKLNANAQAIDAYLYARMPPGALQDFAGPTVPDGWLPCDGRAVGRVEYAALFAAIGGYWGVGDGSTTFNVPDLRGRVTLGVGAGTDDVGAVRNFALAQRFGQWVVRLVQGHMPNYKLSVTTDGNHQHTAATDAQGDHNHTGGTDVQGAHTHAFPCVDVPGVLSGGGMATLPGGGSHPVETLSAGAHGHSFTTTINGAHQHNVTTYAGQGGHTHDVWSVGGDVAHENQQPSVGVTKMIFTGKVSVSATVLNSPAPGSAMARTLALGHAG
jgi:microcystin-dependent protein